MIQTGCPTTAECALHQNQSSHAPLWRGGDMVSRKLEKITEINLKELIFLGPQIREFLNDFEFQNGLLNLFELKVWRRATTFLQVTNTKWS